MEESDWALIIQRNTKIAWMWQYRLQGDRTFKARLLHRAVWKMLILLWQLYWAVSSFSCRLWLVERVDSRVLPHRTIIMHLVFWLLFLAMDQGLRNYPGFPKDSLSFRPGELTACMDAVTNMPVSFCGQCSDSSIEMISWKYHLLPWLSVYNTFTLLYYFVILFTFAVLSS